MPTARREEYLEKLPCRYFRKYPYLAEVYVGNTPWSGGEKQICLRGHVTSPECDNLNPTCEDYFPKENENNDST